MTFDGKTSYVKPVIFLTLLCFLNGVSASAQERKSKAISVSKKKTQEQDYVVAYRFSEHLAAAETVMSLPKGDDIPGKWTGAQFSFPNTPAQFNVSVSSKIFEKQMQKGISMGALPVVTRVIRFPKVLPASKMIVHYGIPDDAFIQNKDLKANLYLTISVGSNTLDRLLIPYERGWKTEILDLGVVAFFLREIPVTFQVSVDEKTVVPFVFDIEMTR